MTETPAGETTSANTPPWPDEIDGFIADLVETRAEIARLREIEKQLVDDIHEISPRRKVETEYGLVEITKRRNRKWDHEELVRHLTRVALDRREIDPETGEIVSRPTWEIVTEALVDCAGIGYWRIGALKDYGLDPDEFAETTSEARSVQIR